MAMLRYVSHPDVRMDPHVPVPRWGLSDRGRARAVAALAQPWWDDVVHLVSSAETKALETAAVFAAHTGLAIEVRPATGEIDRRATGYVAPERHEELAEALFADPDRSAGGWERAVDAQERIRDALADVVTDSPGDVVVVGHGGVGTLLLCHLAGLAIDRGHDQPGQGHHWAWDRTIGALLQPWRPIDAVAPTG